MQSTLSIQAPFIHRNSLYGSPAARFVAFLVDTILLLFFYSFIFYAASNTPQQDFTWKEVIYNNDALSLSDSWDTFKMLFFNGYFVVVHWLYYTILESSSKQATIGKFTLGLRVTDLRGKKINFARANLRYFLKIVSAIPVFLGFLLILNTRRRQMLHDYLARTLVITN